MEERELVIDFKDMVLHVLLKWRTILIMMLAGAVLLGAVYAYMEIKSANKDKHGTIEEAAAIVDSAKANCAEKQIKQAESAFSVYQKKEKLYLLQKEYVQNSLYMQLDPQNVCQTEITYYLKTSGTEVAYDKEEIKIDAYSEDILAAYTLRLESDDVCSEIKTALNLDEKNQYISELIEVENESARVITITVSTDDSETNEKICEVIKSKMESITAELQTMYDPFEMILLSEQMETGSDSDIADEQSKALSEMNELLDDFNSIDADSLGLTDKKAKTYYSALVYEEETKLDTEGNIKITLDDLISVKMIMLGAAAGLIMAIFVIMLLYCMKRKIRTSYDLGNYADSEIIYTYSAGQPYGKSKLDRFFVRKMNKCSEIIPEEEQLEIITASIMNMMQKEEKQSVYFTGNTSEEICTELMKKLAEKLKEKGLSAAYGEFAAKNSNALNKELEFEKTVLVEMLDIVNEKIVTEEIRFCNVNGISLAGCIAVNGRYVL